MVTQLQNKISYLETNKIDTDILKKIIKNLKKNNNSIFKTQQKFRSERRNAFTQEIIKIALSSNYDKRMQSIIR